MCGIAGTAGGGPPEAAVLERMAAVMEHRGPDGRRVWDDGAAGFAFTRLAIIDLHERSSQPLHHEHLHLVFNGEVYNYRELRTELEALGHAFVTEGDGEVLLHAWAEWGEGALERVNAMFAMAVWDERDRRLTLASDPFGEKPLYYTRLGERIVFGSDIKAIAEHPGVELRPDLDELKAFILLGLKPPPSRSYFHGIERLPGAHLLRWRDGEAELERYWFPQARDVPREPAEAAAGLRELLRDSVRLRVRSDVPVGTSLSGGVDSSAVVALTAEEASEATRHSFTARFPGYERDEWRYARAVAASAGVAEHHAVEPSAESLLADLDDLVRFHEEPVLGSSIYAQYRVMRAAKEAGVTVLLDGQGGDEILCGYESTVGYALRSFAPAGLAGAVIRRPRDLARAVRSLAASLLPRPVARLWLRRIGSPYLARGAAEAETYDAFWRDVERPPPTGLYRRGPLPRELLRELFASSLPELLRYADRSSMAHSREVRLPMLDRRVVEYALSLPPELVYRDGVTKAPLRDAVRGRVPDEVLARTDKVGFATPEERWMSAPAFRDRIAEVLLDPAARERGLYDIAAVEADLKRGAWRDAAAIWRAMYAELWLRA